ncbi:MAG: hypothetical protein ABI655_08875 [Phenylobacterium sp.]
MKPLLLAIVCALAAPAARAGEAACWFENGVVVVPASVMGVAGDYILDTGSPHTQLAETQAQGAGFAETALNGDVRLAGVTLKGRPVAVADLDMRTGALPTPIAGVIGVDVLKDYVLDVSFSPCRVVLRRPRGLPAFRPATTLRLTWTASLPVVEAAVSDGPRARRLALTPATGADTAVRLSDALAGAPGAKKPAELYPYGNLHPRLRALSFAGRLFEALPAGLLKPAEGDGQVGAPVLSRYRLRFDFPAGLLKLAPAA